MRLFSHSPADAATVESLAAHLGRTPRAVRRDWLAQGSGPGVLLVALRDVLVARLESADTDPDTDPDPASASDVRRGAPGDVATAVGSSGAPSPQVGWRSWPWQTVQDGGWNGVNSVLQLRLLDGVRRRFVLDQPGQLPSVFAERVQSSILVEEQVEVPGGEVVVSGRRPPVAVAGAERHPVVWHAMARGRADLTDPRVEQLVLRVTERLKLDYDM